MHANQFPAASLRQVTPLVLNSPKYSYAPLLPLGGSESEKKEISLLAATSSLLLTLPL